MNKGLKLSVTLLTGLTLGTATLTSANAAIWHKGLPVGLQGTWVSNKRFKTQGWNGHFRWRLWADQKSVTVVASKDAELHWIPTHVKYRILAHHKYRIMSYMKEQKQGDATDLYYRKGQVTLIHLSGFPQAKMHKISSQPFK